MSREEFKHRNVSAIGESKVVDLRFKFDHVADAIDVSLPGKSRAKSLAMTKLEESFHWLKQAIAEAHSE